MYEVYTDGAYSSSRTQGGSAYVILKNNIKIKEWNYKWNGGTNNIAELCAIIAALHSFKKPCDSIIIYSDSMYCIGILTLGWKIKTNHKFWNKCFEEVERVNKLCFNLQFKHVKGHESSKWNNYVDKLAVQASQLV